LAKPLFQIAGKAVAVESRAAFFRNDLRDLLDIASNF
jgi:hypothetical protein